MKPIVAPSILASDFANLQREITMINESEGDWIHVDIMDGVFVPNISMGLPVVEAVKRHAKKPLDVHLMIVQPERFVEAFQKAGITDPTDYEKKEALPARPSRRRVKEAAPTADPPAAGDAAAS